jgi:diazepam-binding inhibitor (GABA receptor modulating acyl-CoA-binding protein)
VFCLLTARPTGLFDFKEKAKWDAWRGKRGMSQSRAKELYVTKVEALIGKYGINN